MSRRMEGVSKSVPESVVPKIVNCSTRWGCTARRTRIGLAARIVDAIPGALGKSSFHSGASPYQRIGLATEIASTTRAALVKLCGSFGSLAPPFKSAAMSKRLINDTISAAGVCGGLLVAWRLSIFIFQLTTLSPADPLGRNASRIPTIPFFADVIGDNLNGSGRRMGR